MLFLERGVQIISAIYANHLISKALSIEQFGVWQYAFTCSNIIMSLSWMCGSEAVVPQLTRLTLKEKVAYCNTIFFARISISSLAACICIIFAIVSDEQIIKYYLLGSSLAIFVREPLMVGFAKWQAEGKLYYSGVIQITGCIIRILTLYLLSSTLGFDKKLLSLPWVLESIFVGVMIYSFSIKKIPVLHIVKRDDLLLLLKRSIFIWGGVVAYSFFIKLDRVLLKSSLSSSDYGIYSAASQINENTASVTMILIQVLAPILLYKHKTWSVFNRNLSILAIVMFIVFMLFSLLLIPFSPKIFAFIFGEKYVFAANYYNVLIFLLPLYAVDNLVNAANLASKSFYYYSVKWCAVFLLCFGVFTSLQYFLTNSPVLNVYISMYVSLIFSIAISIYWYLAITKKHIMDHKDD